MKPTNNEIKNIGAWLLGGSLGASSKTLAGFYLLQAKNEIAVKLDYPHDPSDLNRCFGFMNCCVDVENRYPLIRAIGKYEKHWGMIYDYWFQLIDIMEKEKNQYSMPNTYEFMKKIYAQIT